MTRRVLAVDDESQIRTLLPAYLEAEGSAASGHPETLAQMSGETRRLRRLAEDLWALSRAEEGRLELAPHQTDLREVVVAAVERLVPQAEDAGVARGPWPVTRDPGTVPVTVDPDRMAQVVTNLVGDALHATPTGGRVTVEVATDASHAVASVTDTGEGHAPADRERIFERFSRVPDRHRASEPGSPRRIGHRPDHLAAHRRSPRRHPGRVATSPGRGRGATFTLRLPLS